MTGPPLRVSAVVFDCDGLLLDTETCWTRAESALFAKYGREFGPTEKDLFIGWALEDACESMAQLLGLPGQGPRIGDELIPLVEQELDADIEPLPGVVDMLDSLAGRVPVAVATNSPRRLLDHVLGRSGLSGYFSASVAYDEVGRPKPEPDVYLAAFGKLGAQAGAGVALEDSATGTAAALASGAYVVTVPSQPGKRLDGHHTAVSLANEALQEWARSVRPL